MNEKTKDIEIVKQVQLAMMKSTDTSRRGQHFKQHACVEARFHVLDNIPNDLKVGLFSKPACFKAYIRFSNGAQMDDRIPDVHGMAIKLVGVEGKKILEGEEDATTHDFILADNPLFFIRTAAEYVPFIKDFAESAAEGKPPERFIAWLQQNHPEDVAVLQGFRQQIQDSPLTASYWSQVPYALGVDNKRICRYSTYPNKNNPGNATLAADQDKDYLRKTMVEALAEGKQGASFDFSIQPLADTRYEVVNNPTVEWDSPNYKVAEITIDAQEFDTPERKAFGENLSYTPWHALPEHRPVGEVNEVRKQVYLASSALRHETNGTVSREPSLAQEKN